MSKTFVFGHRNPDTDAIASAIVMAHLESQLSPDAQIEAVALGDPSSETRYALEHFGIVAPRVIETARPDAEQVILVDHNERQQSVRDIDEVVITKVVDHHRIANFETSAPLWFRAEPLGCTCTILWRMYDENDVPIPADLAGLMASAIISDTLLLRSPTTTEYDRRAASDSPDGPESTSSVTGRTSCAPEPTSATCRPPNSSTATPRATRWDRRRCGSPRSTPSEPALCSHAATSSSLR